jgi:hypothetical protein
MDFRNNFQTTFGAKTRLFCVIFASRRMANVVVIEPSGTPTFDFWLRISTLEVGKPILVPLALYGRAKETLAEVPQTL